jgi:uncharacterized protein YjbI with pentapeptide repeats
VKIKNLTPFPCGAKVTSRRPPEPEMTLFVRAAYELAPGAPLALPGGGKLIAQGSMSADTYREEDEERAGECLYPGDFADWKPRAEVMLRGTCHTPFGKPLTECPVRFEVGPWSKILRVVGRRFWSDDLPNAVMSEPAPFTTMPLGYASAFGGPGYAENPVGKGFAGRELPSVEHAGRVIRGRRDDPGPAGFGPINPAWPGRAQKLGKEYGPRWRRERRPFYAEDFDFTYFNAAPADQQLDGYMRGDEALLFQNLHPTEQVLETRLPGLRVRAFVKDDRQRFREVGMSLDTLFADLEEGRLYLTWRGLDATLTDDMKDVKTVLVASEPLADPRLPEAHYRGLLEAFEADPIGVARRERLPAEKLEKIDAMKLRLADHTKGAAPAEPREPAPDPLTARLRDQLAALPGPVAGANDMERSIASAVAQATAKAPPGVDMKAKLAEMAAAAPKPPAVRKSVPGAIALRPGGPPPAWASKALEGSLKNLEETRKQLAEAKLPPGEGGKEAGEKLAEMQKQLDEQMKVFDEDPFFKKLKDRPPPREPAPGADLHAQDYEGRDLRDRDLRGANLRDCNLAGAILRGARLDGACLDGAVLVGADITGADFTGADLTLANLTGVSGKGAVFREATLDRAWLKKADLAGAVLAGAKGKMLFLPECDLTGADGKGLSLDQAFAKKAILAGADLTGATLLGCYFLDADARKAVFAKTLLGRSSFGGADLSGSSFAEARGDRTIWLRARLHDASFRRVFLPNASFMEASATRAVFRCGYLREARCYRGSFEHGDFSKANLVGADFSKCALSRARFTGANLYAAKFIKAAGEGCDFSDANLKRTQLEEA